VFITGTLLNAAAVLLGGLLGTFLGDRLPARLRETLLRGAGLFTLAIGIKLAIDTASPLYPLGAILLGGLVGSGLELDRRLTAFGDAMQRRFGSGRGTVSEAFVTSTLVFCVGPLTFLGAVQNGLTGDTTLLAIKSALDGFAAIAFAAALGWGVLLSIGVILVYQGGVSAFASLFQGLLTDAQLRESSAAGGLLLLGVGLRLLRIRDVGVADLLPAILVAPLLVGVVARLQGRGPF
jgi:uncharacterized membrane protein YqgA involved in biofilm formation